MCGTPRSSLDSHHKGSVVWKAFPSDAIVMISQYNVLDTNVIPVYHDCDSTKAARDAEYAVLIT